MERIYPICEEKIRPYIGKTVCAVLHDGTWIQGCVTNVDGQNLHLSFEPSGGNISSQGKKGKVKQLPKKGKKALTSKKRGSKKADVSSFYPSPYPYPYPYGYGYGYGWGAGAFAISLALIAALFATPFFFI